MGCSSSAMLPSEQSNEKKTAKQLESQKNKQVIANANTNGQIKTTKSNDSQLKQKSQTIDSNGNKLDPMAQKPVPKSVAFDVTLDGQNSSGLLSTKKRPPRLQVLDPLNVPKLTAEQLQEKQRIADEKREKLKQKKIKASQRTSRRRLELMKAQEFGLKQQTDDAKVKHVQNLSDDAEFEGNKGFSADKNDIWPGIQNSTNNTDNEKLKLQKKIGQETTTMRTSPVPSSGSTFKTSNTNNTLQTIHNLQNNVHIMSDDFFDS